MNESKTRDSDGEESDVNDVNSNVNGLTEKDAFELHRLRVLHDIQGEVTEWTKKRFGLFVLIATVLGFFGVSAIIESSIRSSVDKELESVRDTVREANKTIGKSEAALDYSKKQIEQAVSKAKAATENAAKKAKDISLLARQLETEITGLRQETESLSVQIVSLNANVRQEARDSIDSQKEQLKNIEELVAELSSPTINAKQKIKETQAAQETLRSEAEDARARYDLLSQYNIDIIISDGETIDLENIKQALTSNGFIVGGVFGKGRALEKTASMWGVSAKNLSGKYVVMHYPEDRQIADLLRNQLVSLSNIVDVELIKKTIGSKNKLGIYVPSKL